MANKEAQEKVARIRKKHAKSVPMLIQESDLWDWNPTKRLLLLVIALGTRKEKEDYSDTFIQKDCPLTAEEAVGWCDMAQWRLALRVGITEDYVSELINEFEKVDQVLRVKRWEDDNGTKHNMYQVIADVVREHQREQKKGVERAPYYKVKRGTNKGSFSSANQPGKNREVREMDDEE